MAQRLPSLGFLLLCTVYGSAIVFFLWGLSTPDLDRVWRAHHLLKIGQPVTEEDRSGVERSIARHPQLAEALLDEGRIGILSAHDDGWIETPTVTILRTSASTADRIELAVRTPEDRIPYSVRLEAGGYERQLEVTAPGDYDLELPPRDGKPSLMTLRLVGDELRADPSVLGVRVGLRERTQPKGAGK